MRKLISIILSMILVLAFSSTAFADQPKQDNKANNQQNDIKDMLESGLSMEDATYYFKLNDMIKKLENDGVKIVFDESIPDMSDADVTKDIKTFRQRVLAGDKMALKKALSSPVYTRGVEDTKKLMSRNIGQSKYEVKYADGSSIRLTVSQGNLQDDKVNPSSYLFSSKQVTQSGYYTDAYALWTLSAPSSWSKVKITVSYELNLSNAYSKIDYAIGDYSSYGVVDFKSTNGGAISRSTNNNNYGVPAEAYNSVIFSVSNTFAGSYGPLSVSVSRGNTFTQKVFYQVWGDGWQYAIADVF